MYHVIVPKERADEALKLAADVKTVRVCLGREGELTIFSATDEVGRAPEDAQELFDKLAAEPEVEREQVEAEVEEEHDTPAGRVVRKVKKLVSVPKKKK